MKDVGNYPNTDQSIEAETHIQTINEEDSNKYNGWTNYESWLLKLNLDNDHSLYLMCQEYFEDVDLDTTTIYEVGQSFKEYLEELFFIEEHSIIKICDTWTWRDWAEINFYEIIQAFIDERAE